MLKSPNRARIKAITLSTRAFDAQVEVGARCAGLQFSSCDSSPPPSCVRFRGLPVAWPRCTPGRLTFQPLWRGDSCVFWSASIRSIGKTSLKLEFSLAKLSVLLGKVKLNAVLNRKKIAPDLLAVPDCVLGSAYVGLATGSIDFRRSGKAADSDEMYGRTQRSTRAVRRWDFCFPSQIPIR